MREIASLFQIPGDWISAAPYGNGHINDTYAVNFRQGGTPLRYLFQRINHRVFKQPALVMDNIIRVTQHVHGGMQEAPDRSRRTLTVIPARSGLPYARDHEGSYWRAYVFVENTRYCDVVETPDQAFQVARAFGQFQRLVSGLPGPRLHEVIPGFHDTPARMQTLEDTVAIDTCGRVRECEREIAFALSHKSEARLLLDLHAAGELPERITHNDTKVNNVLLDAASGEGLCVIDLDTVMPGLVHYDFGDMVRTAASSAAEDEADLTNVHTRFDLFEALLRGYLETAGEILSPVEKHYLPFSGKLITLEIGTRFLTDYLEGDRYFKIKRAGHNLDRCRNQFQLVRSIDAQYHDMMSLLDSVNEGTQS